MAVSGGAFSGTGGGITHRKPKILSNLTLPAAIAPRYESPDPPNIAGSYGPLVIAWAKRQLGLDLGGWQAYVLWQILRHDSSGNLLARIALLSTGRQNGKSVIVRALFGWLLDEGWKMEPFSTWTTLLAAAHDQRQARIIYQGVNRDVLNRADQSQEIRSTRFFGITSGPLDFDTVSNQPGSARGWSAGAIAWDEMLTQRDWQMWEALAPTQSAQRSPIMLLTSTAGHDDSLILRAFYDRLVRQATGAEAPDPSFYGVWFQSENPDAGLDWREVQLANPALGLDRLTRAAIESEYAVLPPDSWRRERLNHFVDRKADAAINPSAWANCRTPKPLEGVDGPFALGVDVAVGNVRATIAVAAIRPDGRIGVEIFRDLRPTRDELISSKRILEAVQAFSEPIARIAYDKSLAVASTFERDAEESTLSYDPLTPPAMTAASMDVLEMITSGRLAVGDPLLDAQAPLVVRRPVGQEGAFRFSRGLSEQPIDAFLAMVLAAHAIAYSLKLPQIF